MGIDIDGGIVDPAKPGSRTRTLIETYLVVDFDFAEQAGRDLPASFTNSQNTSILIKFLFSLPIESLGDKITSSYNEKYSEFQHEKILTYRKKYTKYIKLSNQNMGLSTVLLPTPFYPFFLTRWDIHEIYYMYHGKNQIDK